MKDSLKVAILAYNAAINEIAEIQRRMTQRHALSTMFMSRALPVQEFYRKTLPSKQDSMIRASDYRAMEAEADKKRLEWLYDLVDDMELMFQKYHDADDKAFAEGLADYIRGKYPR